MDLDAWKNGITLVKSVYKITQSFPGSELFGLSSQMRRAAVSIPSNIAEGAARHHNREFIQFLYIATGSLAELETQFIISHDLGYMDVDTFNNGNDILKTIRSQILGLIKYLNAKHCNYESYMQPSLCYPVTLSLCHSVTLSHKGNIC